MDENGVNSVDVKELLLEMRSYRMGLIQTPDQLRFSYQAIIEGVNSKDWLIVNDVRTSSVIGCFHCVLGISKVEPY